MEQIFANPYLLGTVVALGLYMLLFFLKRISASQVEKILGRSNNRVDDVIVYALAHTSHVFMLITSLYAGFQFFPQHKTYPTWSWRIFFVVLMLQIAIWGLYGIRKWVQLSFSRKRKRDPGSASSINVVELMVKFTFITLVLMFTLHNIGIQVTTMIAGLGIGGVAIALALQNILGDLFSSLSIILDKPFVVGDFIVMGEWLGEVEHIGLKTTRIRSLSGEQIIISNSDLLGSRIRNMKRMHERRHTFILALPHETDVPTLKKAVEIIRSVVISKKQTRFDRCHYFRVSTSSLDIETVYFILSDDYNVHMDILQSIMLDIHQLFTAEDIHYACPPQRIPYPGSVQNLNLAVENQNQNRPLV